MRTIAHISDVHFGREDARVVEALLEELHAARPDVVAVSGDLTQRARRSQFAAARRFLDRLPAPAVVVPGNHDVPLFDVGRRFLSPLGRYRRHITGELAPVYRDDELVVLGLNSARSNVWKGGRVSAAQVAVLRSAFCAPPAPAFKALVVHHPLIGTVEAPREPTAGGARTALEAAAACGVDLVLTGHTHVAASGDARAFHASLTRSILVVQAGTAVSRRRRGEPNGYALVHVEPEALSLDSRVYDGRAFAPASRQRFVRAEDGWRAVVGGAA